MVEYPLPAPEHGMRAAILLSALVGLGLVADARADMAFVAISPAARSFHVGALTVTALHDSEIDVSNDGKVFGLGAGADAVAKVLRTAGAPADRIPLSVNALLVRTGGHIVLIDTGLGPKNHGVLLSSLKLAGVSPGAVTDVLLTHPHLDHIGGLLDADGHLAFPHATIRMASAAWAWMQKNVPPPMADVPRIVAAHVRTFEPGARVAPGIVSISLPGHTPGHVGYEIVSGHSRLIDIGDLAHSSIVSLADPQWGVQFDNDRALARDTRLKVLPRLAKNDALIFAPHFPFPGVGHIVAAGDAFTWKPGLP